jgi:hypothetical protein
MFNSQYDKDLSEKFALKKKIECSIELQVTVATQWQTALSERDTERVRNRELNRELNRVLQQKTNEKDDARIRYEAAEAELVVFNEKLQTVEREYERFRETTSSENESLRGAEDTNVCLVPFFSYLK